MTQEPAYSVHNEEGFQRVYDEDDPITIRTGDLRALLDLATQSMDFASGFMCEEDVECLHAVARVLGVDLLTVTPHNFQCKYNGPHKWEFKLGWGYVNGVWFCSRCRHMDSTRGPDDPPGAVALPNSITKAESEKADCPYCKREFVDLASHISKQHSNV